MAGVYERKDHLYQQAKESGYRSRAAYKLLEIDRKFGILQTGAAVVDLGCFPGGWIQIAGKKVGKAGVVIGVDLDEVPGFSPGDLPAKIHLLRGDASTSEVQQQIVLLAGGPVNVVLSDMSPKLTGVRFGDAARSAELVEVAAGIASRLLTKGGAFVAKVFPGSESDAIFQKLRPSYEQFTRHVLKASRKTSSEYYFVGRGFR